MNTRNLRLLTAASVLIVAPVFAGDQAHKTSGTTGVKGTAEHSSMQQAPSKPKMGSKKMGQAMSDSRSFDSVDMDGNAELDVNELRGVQRALNELEGTQDNSVSAEDILSSYDNDSSGTLNKEEYQAMLDDRTGGAESGVKQTRAPNLSKAPSRQSMPAGADRVVGAGTVSSSNSGSGSEYNIQSAQNGGESLVTLDNSDAKRLEAKQTVAREDLARADPMDNKDIRETAKENPGEINPSVTSPADISVSQNVYTAPIDRIEGKDVEGERGEKIGTVDKILVKNDGSDAALLIVNEQGEALFTPVADVRMNEETLILVSTSRPTKDYNKSLYSEIDRTQKNITSAIAILSISAL
ncbi:MAG TPA: EF-hand domain-containing protein [Marinagarivorans sp.]